MDDHRLFVLLGGHYAHVPPRAQAMHQGLIGEKIESLNGFAVDVARSRRPQHVGEPRPSNFRRYNFCRQGNP